jgi:hypothetical protein
MTQEHMNPNLLGLLHRDYDAASGLARSASQSADRTRSFGLTLVAAVLGVAVSTSRWQLGPIGVLLTLSVAIVDGYYSWQYERALEHLRRIEAIERLRFDAMKPPSRASQGAQPSAGGTATQRRLETKLRGFKLGTYSELKRFRITEVLYLQPYPVFRGLYVVAVCASIGAGIISYGSHSTPTTVRVEHVR